MSDDESPFHCSDCGFCRLGGAENYRHCHDCGVCIDLRLFNSHNCKEGKFKSDCPVCLEYLLTSRSASHEMPCGHAIHWDCFRQLAEHDLRCPLCKKTAVDKKQMMERWNVIAADVAMHPLPPEQARVVNIACNGCELQDDAPVPGMFMESSVVIVPASTLWSIALSCSGSLRTNSWNHSTNRRMIAITCYHRGVALASVSRILCDDLDWLPFALCAIAVSTKYCECFENKNTYCTV
jgi:Ring finger domain